MPWTVDDVDRFKKGLTKTQKKRWVKIANSSYQRCADEGEKTNLDCEVSAIRIANTKFSDKNFSIEENTCPGVPGLNFKEFQEVALQEAEVTDDYQMVLPVGLFYSRWYGEIIITQNYCQALVDNWKKKVLREQKPFVDTEHDRGRANGWFQDFEAREDGLYAKIEWTDLGREQVGKGLYKYFSSDISSVVDIDTGEEIYPVLIAVALCNTPVMKTMPQAHLQDKPPGSPDSGKTGTELLALAESLKSAIIRKYDSAHSDGVHILPKDKNMDEILKLFNELSNEEKVNFAEKLSESLKDADGADPGAGAELPGKDGGQADPHAGDVTTSGDTENPKLAELVKQNEKMAKQLAELLKAKDQEGTVETPQTGNSVFDARMAALEHSNKQMAEQINKITLQDHAKKKEEVIGLALKEGRMLPKDKEFYEGIFDKDPQGTEAILKRTPSVKIFSEEGTGADGSAYKLNETAEEKAIREKMGITIEEAAKYGESYKPPR